MEDRGRRFCSVGALAWLAAAALVASATALGIAVSRSGGSLTTVALQATLIVAGLGGAATMWRRSGPRTFVAIVAVALVARAVLIPWPPLQSNDLYRYLWDGRLLLHGIDPYVVSPDAPQLDGLRSGDWLYAHIDWRTVPTLYPPVDLALYTLAAALSGPFGQTLVPLKLVLILGDVATILLVARQLCASHLPMGRLALYAWNPLAIVEFGLNGHEESWAIAFLIAAILAFRASKPAGAALAMAGAVLTKLYPAAFIPALFARRTYVPAAFFCAALVALAYAPFVFWNRDALGFLHSFTFGYHFNDSLHLIIGAFGSAAIFLFALVIAGVAVARGASALTIVLALELVYLLISPNVYPWYVVVFAALLPLVPNVFSGTMRPLGLALVAWTALAPLAYLEPWVVPGGSPLDDAAHVVEYAPLILALIWYVRRGGPRLAALVAGAVAIAGCAAHPRAAVPAHPATAQADVARGAAFFAANCALCHTPTATSIIGPDLTHVAARRSGASLAIHIATSVPRGSTFPAATVASLVAYLQVLNERSTTK